MLLDDILPIIQFCQPLKKNILGVNNCYLIKTDVNGSADRVVIYSFYHHKH